MTQNVNLGQESPRVVSPYGSLQALLATLPLLAVLIYFVYDAYVRPSLPIYAGGEINDDVALSQAWSETPPLIKLYDMVPVFLTFQGLFSILYAYLKVFVHRRRTLLRSYVEKGETSLGDVLYDDTPRCCGLSRGGTQYGEVVYAYPNTTKWTVRKRVRLYQHYSRERVTILRLMNRPFSGQPKTDVQIDLQASQGAMSQMQTLSYLALAWIIFTFLSPIFIIYQMTKLHNDDYEDVSMALKIYVIFGVIVIPIVSFVGVYLRWAVYRHWVVNRGWLMKETENDTEGMGAQDENVVSVFVTELAGRQHRQEVSAATEDSSATPYIRMGNNKQSGGSSTSGPTV